MSLILHNLRNRNKDVGNRYSGRHRLGQALEFNRLLDYYRDAPKIDFIDEKPRRERKEKGHERPSDPREKDRRTAEPGMARMYVNAGKSDGFYAGNLIDMLNHLVQGKRVDVL